VDIQVFYLQRAPKGLFPIPEDEMADSPKSDDGKGAPNNSAEKTVETPPRDFRLFPGGRLDAPPVGVNAVDRDDLPSYGLSPTTDYKHSPDDEEP
jgi:hypothetical protein